VTTFDSHRVSRLCSGFPGATLDHTFGEGRPVDIESIVDASLLVDGWEEMFLPRAVRSAWQPLVEKITHDA